MQHVGALLRLVTLDFWRVRSGPFVYLAVFAVPVCVFR